MWQVLQNRRRNIAVPGWGTRVWWCFAGLAALAGVGCGVKGAARPPRSKRGRGDEVGDWGGGGVGVGVDGDGGGGRVCFTCEGAAGDSVACREGGGGAGE